MNAATTDGFTALHWAAKKGWAPIVKALLAAGAGTYPPPLPRVNLSLKSFAAADPAVYKPLVRRVAAHAHGRRGRRQGAQRGRRGQDGGDQAAARQGEEAGAIAKLMLYADIDSLRYL